MPNEFNLFEHHHDHGHEHEHDAALAEPLDPAQQSLADALRVSFGILKLVMAALVIFYLFSGSFKVEANSVAVRLFFGKIMSKADAQPLQPGWHLAAPYPFMDHILIPTTKITLRLDKEFWYALTPEEEKKKPDDLVAAHSILDPEKDGSMITGDANIVNAKWTITYEITDPVKYLENVGDLDHAAALVRDATQDGAIYTVAQATADHLVQGLDDADKSTARRHIQDSLDAMNSGLTVSYLTAEIAMPLSVLNSYRAVAGALGEKGQLIEAAKQQKAQTLGETAGDGYEQLLELVNEFEAADRKKDQPAMARINTELDHAFYDLQVGQGPGLRRVGGEVAMAINDAKSYRSRIVDELSSEASRFTALLPQYDLYPQILLSSLWADARASIFTGDVETFYLPSNGTIYLETNRDPKVQAQRERDRLAAENAQTHTNPTLPGAH